MDTKTIATTLGEIVDQLEGLLSAIADGEPKLPQKAKDRIEKGLCLLCGEGLSDGKRTIRGTHERCYKKIKEGVKAGRTTWAKAINDGLVAPSLPPGRKKGAGFEAYISDEIKQIESADTAFRAKKAAKKSRRKPE